MPQGDYLTRRLYLPESIPRAPPMPYEGNGNSKNEKGGVRYV